MKKCIYFAPSILLTAVLLCGCAASPTPTAPAADGPLKIVTTIFPLYDWVMNILGDRAGSTEVTLLLDNGADLHSYQPTVDDMVKISESDLFVYVGGESDEWVADALREAVNPRMEAVDLLELLGDAVKEEEVVEGMEEEHDHDHDQDDHDQDDHDQDDHEEAEYDEHVWLSLKNAAAICAALAEDLGRLDPEHRDTYVANAAAYIEKLEALDAAYAAAVDAAPTKTVLFGDRFPFRYLTDDYGLSYFAAFVGCSAETEASFETVLFLADKTDELGLTAILQIETADGSIARTIRDNTEGKDQTILTLNSLQSVTAADVEEGVTYLSTMEENLAVLRQALS